MRTIKSRREFGEVFSSGTRASGKLVRITYLKRSGEGKVAFVAAKRLGNAVFRNRCKRILREAAREADLPVEGYAIILFSTNKTHAAKPSAVAEELSVTLTRAGLM